MEIYKQIIAIMRDVPAIPKDKQVSAGKFRYDYRSAESVVNTLRPYFVKHGVFTTPEIVHMERHEITIGQNTPGVEIILTVRYTFAAEDGSSVQATTIGIGQDSGDKAANKAMTVALRYAYSQVLMLATEELTTDPERDNEPARRKAQPRQPAAEPIEPLSDRTRAAIMQHLDDAVPLTQHEAALGLINALTSEAQGQHMLTSMQRKYPLIEHD